MRQRQDPNKRDSKYQTTYDNIYSLPQREDSPRIHQDVCAWFHSRLFDV